MTAAQRLTRFLRLGAALVFTVTLVIWFATGAHLGWTRTSVTEIQHDGVTGIDFPVEHAKFVAGIDVLVFGAGLAGALGISSILLARFQLRARADC